MLFLDYNRSYNCTAPDALLAEAVLTPLMVAQKKLNNLYLQNPQAAVADHSSEVDLECWGTEQKRVRTLL